MAGKSVFNYPDSAERDYVRALLAYTKSLRKESEMVLEPAISKLSLMYQADYRGDSWLDELDQLMAELALAAALGFSALVAKLPFQFEKVSSFNESQFAKAFKAGTGRPLPVVMPGVPESLLVGSVFRSEPFLKPLAAAWIKENTALIKSLPTQLHSDLEGIVRRGVMGGSSVREIKDQIKAKYNVSDYRAKLIAQDQTLKLNSNLTEFRLKSVGVKSYVWETSNDSRVRPEHGDRSGKVYTWAKPPAGGKHPGQEIRCRCRAGAIWPKFD